jgi:hypothetical protein
MLEGNTGAEGEDQGSLFFVTEILGPTAWRGHQFDLVLTGLNGAGGHASHALYGGL